MTQIAAGCRPPITKIDSGAGAAGLVSADGLPRSGVSPNERAVRLGQRGGAVWLTGRPGSGKSTLAFALERRLFDLGYLPTVLDPDQVGDPDRFEHERAISIQGVADTARRFSAAGLVTIAAFATSKRKDRDTARDSVGADRFFEVFVDTPADVCRDRDTRDLYARLDAGRLEVALPEFEPPTAPDLTVSLESDEVDDIVDRVIDAMREKGLLIGT